MKKEKVSKLFIIISLIVGSILVFLIPPFQSPDEDAHFLKSYVMSEGKVIPEQNANKVGYYYPLKLQEYINEKLEWMGNRDKKYSYSEMYNDMFVPINYSEKYFKSFSTNFITPIAHLAPTLGILFSKICGTNPSTVNILYFARFFSMILYSLLGYFAIKRTPAYKKTMFTILLLPMALFLRSSITYDSLLLPIVLIFIAEFLNLKYSKTNYNWKYTILFIAIGYILLNVKVIYFPILLLLFLLPSKVFGTRKDKIKIAGIIGGAILLLTIISKIPSFVLNIDSTGTSSEQLNFVLSHPIYFFKILISNILADFKNQIYWMFGTYGLLDTYMPTVFVYLTLFNILLISFLDAIYEKIKTNLSVKLVLSICIILVFLLSYTVMYISWTPQVLGVIGGNQITGIQGRYFIPVLIYLPLLFSNRIKLRKTDNLMKELYQNYYYLIPIVTILIMLLTIFVRYWV